MSNAATPTMDAANQLEALKSMSKVVADTGDIKAIKLYKPVDCTTNPSLLLKALQMPEYQHYLQKAIEEEAASGAKPDARRPFAPVVDRLAVSVGADLLQVIPGRVSTEVDAHLSYDTKATVAKARRLIALYKERGVPPERVYIKIASTWEGIQACKQLQQEGIDCNLTLLFSFAQGVACANAKAALISPFVGRILDWYKKHEGRDFSPADDPGVLSVKRIYRYYKRFGVDTVVMAASFRNVGEIRELAGCDNITIAPALLQQLEECMDPLPRALNPALAATECDDEILSHMDEALFRRMHDEDQMAVDKLKEGIEGFAKDQVALEQMLADLVSDQKTGAEDEQELYI